MPKIDLTNADPHAAPIIDSLIWAQLPHDAQRLLSGSPIAAKLNLYFNDDGSCAVTPAQAGAGLGYILALGTQEAPVSIDGSVANIMDALRCATEFTEALCRKEVNDG